MFSDNKNLKSGIKKNDDLIIGGMPMDKPIGMLFYMDYPANLKSQSCTETGAAGIRYAATDSGKPAINLKDNINGTGEEYLHPGNS